MSSHVHPVQIYYEDTDHSGLVYHANYLKYFERAREQVFGANELVRLHAEEGIGFVVYKAEITFKAGAVFGDTVDVRTRVEKESVYRLLFHQDVYRPRDQTLLVEGLVHLVCVDTEKQLVRVPASVLARFHD